MKEIVDRIRNLCKQNGTSITKLEEKLGYANGTIGKWAKAKRKPPLEKVIDIARELDTTVEYVMNGEQKEKADSPKGTGQSEIDIIFSQLTPSRQAKLIELARLYLDDQRRSEET